MTKTMTKTVLVHYENSIAWVKLNRPERLNAMNQALVDDLAAALDEIETRDEIRTIILHGEGRAFCSGDDLQDLDAQTGSRAAAEAWVASIQAITPRIMGSSKIVIAAVHGWCVGGALEWIINCDFCIFAENARWFFPEVSYGFFVTGGVTALLTKQIGPQKTKELIILGERQNASRALDVGIAWKVVPDSDLLNEARLLAEKIAERPAVSVAAIKAAINQGLHSSLEAAMLLETRATVDGFLSTEAQARAKQY